MDLLLNIWISCSFDTKYYNIRKQQIGWYYVNKIGGKGICFGNVDKIRYDEDSIEKYAPTKDEALKLKQRDIPRRYPINFSLIC